MRRTGRAMAVLAVAVAVLAAGCEAELGQAGGGAASGTSGSGAGEPAGGNAGGTAGGSGGSGTGTTGEGPATTRILPGRAPAAPSSPTTRRPVTAPTTAVPPTTPPTTAGPAPVTTAPPTTTRALAAPDASRGGSGFSAPGEEGAAGGSGGSSRAFDDPPDRSSEPGTRPPPTEEELNAVPRETPSPGTVLFLDAITLLPPFVLLACLAGLLTYAALPPEQRYRTPFPDGTTAQRIAERCAVYDVQPLRTRSVSSGGSSRAVQPEDVQLEVAVGAGTGTPGSKRVIVRERLREGVRTPEQGFLVTLAMLLLLVVLTATAAAGWRSRSRR